MKRHLRASSLLFNQPLLVTPDMLDLGIRWANQVMNLNIINLGAGAARLWQDDGDQMVRLEQAEERRRSAVTKTGVEVIPVAGVLVSRGAHLDPCETMTSYEGLRAQLRAAVA
ncbi:S49 family peptidase, partial [Pseudomonas aeruginosa]|nr:S49 family peptidase [Pseudomonas aeruginosa]